MAGSSLRSRIRELVSELAQFHGYRTVWIDLGGQLCHSEPDSELERLGYLYVLTALRPSEDELADAVSRFVTLERSGVEALASWSMRPIGAELVPA